MDKEQCNTYDPATLQGGIVSPVRRPSQKSDRKNWTQSIEEERGKRGNTEYEGERGEEEQGNNDADQEWEGEMQMQDA